MDYAGLRGLDLVECFYIGIYITNSLFLGSANKSIIFNSSSKFAFYVVKLFSYSYTRFETDIILSNVLKLKCFSLFSISIEAN